MPHGHAGCRRVKPRIPAFSRNPNLFDDEYRRNKLDKMERCVDRIRGQFGQHAIQRAIHLKDRLKGVNANNDIGDAQIFYKY